MSAAPANRRSCRTLRLYGRKYGGGCGRRAAQSGPRQNYFAGTFVWRRAGAGLRVEISAEFVAFDFGEHVSEHQADERRLWRNQGKNGAGTPRANRQDGSGRIIRPRQGLREKSLHVRLHDRGVGRRIFSLSLPESARREFRSRSRWASLPGICIAKCGARTAST